MEVNRDDLPLNLESVNAHRSRNSARLKEAEENFTDRNSACLEKVQSAKEVAPLNEVSVKMVMPGNFTPSNRHSLSSLESPK